MAADFISLPHVLFDSLYVKAGSRLPNFYYFFQKALGCPVFSLWYADAKGWGDIQVGNAETNMRRSGCLPAPEAFTAQKMAVFFDDGHGDALHDVLDRCEYDFRIGSKVAQSGTLLNVEQIADRPHSLFSSSFCGVGSLKPAVPVDGFLKAPILSQMYFSVELHGYAAKVQHDLRLWFCLYGQWEGPADSMPTPEITALPDASTAQRKDGPTT